jgi:N-acetylmuramoyl-L-alanine amidase
MHGKKYKEKNITLAVAKNVYYILKRRGYKVYMTRNKDRFVSLRYRTKYANKKKANIFVSIHANSVGRKKARKIKGIETFFLSPARSKRAKRIAALENKGDLRGLNYGNKNAILNTLNRTKITQSHKLSIDIHRNVLYNVRKVHSDVIDMGVREGPFWVLVGTQMPSVLIELGYISHYQERRRLVSKKYQKALSVGIADGIEAYFKNNQ